MVSVAPRLTAFHNLAFFLPLLAQEADFFSFCFFLVFILQVRQVLRNEVVSKNDVNELSQSLLTVSEEVKRKHREMRAVSVKRETTPRAIEWDPFFFSVCRRLSKRVLK